MYGITSGAVSKQKATKADIEHTKQLQLTLRRFGAYANAAQNNLRQRVLEKIEECLDEFVCNKQSKKPGCQLRTFGSYRLDLHDNLSDIDVLCIAPIHVSRAMFFEFAQNELEKKLIGVKDVLCLLDAFVPVVKFQLDSIHVDLLFVSLPLHTIPNDIDLTDDKYLHLCTSMADTTLCSINARCLNGCRVAELVPEEKTFKLALRAVKKWARVNGIHSNICGYLGGVNWAILVARICQLYPNASASTIVHKFFTVYKLWKWKTPILLNPVDRIDSHVLNNTVWDPRRNTRDQVYSMAIITPAFPAMNSSFNVTSNTLRVVVSKLTSAASILSDIEKGESIWDDLFIDNNNTNNPQLGIIENISTALYDGDTNTSKKEADYNQLSNTNTFCNSCDVSSKSTNENKVIEDVDNDESTSSSSGSSTSVAGSTNSIMHSLTYSSFFTGYRHYLEICVSSSLHRNQLGWIAWCESKLRYLASTIENTGMVEARLLPLVFHNRCLHRIHNNNNSNSNSNDDNSKSRISSLKPDRVCEQFVYIGLDILAARSVSRIDLTSIWREFASKLKRWPEITRDMDITVQHLRSQQYLHMDASIKTTSKRKRGSIVDNGGDSHSEYTESDDSKKKPRKINRI